jgi:hypothetical protein
MQGNIILRRKQWNFFVLPGEWACSNRMDEEIEDTPTTRLLPQE